MCIGKRESKGSGSTFCFSFSESLLLCTSVLEPDLDLSLSKFEVLGKFCPLCYREVLLLAKLSL